MIPENILRLLPESVALAAKNETFAGKAEEIRLRLEGRSSMVLCGGEEVNIGAEVTEKDLNETLLRVCGGSLHSFGDFIAKGWLPLPGGGRVGVCGRAFVSPKGDFVEGVTRISSMNFRIPRSVGGISGSICRYLASCGYGVGLLICSPPGVGKTTLLRDVAAALSKPPHNRRVAVIDSRSELWREDMFRHSLADRYDQYPRGEGIELATRTMSPHLIVCDELAPSDALAVLSAQNSGVPLIASAHARSVEEAMMRRDIAELVSKNVFRCIVALKRSKTLMHLDFSELSVSETDDNVKIALSRRWQATENAVIV